MVRRGYGDTDCLAAVLESQPPTIYFLDGTTTTGPVRYDSRTLTSAFDVRLLMAIDWNGADITAETRRTVEGTRNRSRFCPRSPRGIPPRPSSPGRLPLDHLQRWPWRDRSDYLVVEELATGEVHLGLWHAKASNGTTPAIRVKDFQEVVAQALRSRRQFPSTTLWTELGARLSGQARPVASAVEGSDNPDLLRRKLGLIDGDESEPPWTQRYPAVRGTLGIVQPGLSAEAFRTDLSEDPVPPGAQSLRELFGVLMDMPSRMVPNSSSLSRLSQRRLPLARPSNMCWDHRLQTQGPAVRTRHRPPGKMLVFA